MTEEQRDNLLIVISNMIKEQATALGKISATLNEHTEMLKEHTQELIKQRQNMVKLEHELTDKIMALFDLGEVNNDKFEEEDLRIKGMQNTLDWHNRRILKLETAN